MQSEYQSPESPAAAIEGSYSYPEVASRPATGAESRRRTASELFRYRVVKRFGDVALVILSVPVVLLVIGIIALMVKLSSPGPVFYSHRRIRKGGAFFSMWKFRTMCINSAEVLEEHLARYPEARMEWNKTHKLRKDPRITPIGSFLRRYSLDELPQLWNVLAGQMSLVGPRPIVAAEVEKYGDCFQCYCRVKPGLTGLWQVSGRSTVTYQKRVALDCEYVAQWSLMRDCVILLKTFSSVWNQDGAF
ncbi:MAG: sugar transferase [Acidobacteriota bacterium]|nr:sugar transferase [Acidobacteriota bacterium]